MDLGTRGYKKKRNEIGPKIIKSEKIKDEFLLKSVSDKAILGRKHLFQKKWAFPEIHALCAL